MRTISILGVTGSIGQNTLNVIRYQSRLEEFKVVALTANKNVQLLANNAKEFRSTYAVISDESKYKELKNAVSDSDVIPLSGLEGLNAVTNLNVDWTMNAIVGFAGLRPSLECAKNGNTLALANKESLVCGGSLLMSTINETGGKLLPVDSEHSAIFQCLKNESKKALNKVILTASGGPFRTWSRTEIAGATLEQATDHPNWKMGTRISIDSATMFNKALEVIETKYLFDISISDIEVLVHPESIVHSMVSFRDGSVMAQLSVPDMKGAIGYALNYPDRLSLPVETLDLANIKSLNFEKANLEKFPALELAYNVLDNGELFGAVLNAAKEVALDKFISGQIKFLDITKVVRRVLQATEMRELQNKRVRSFHDVQYADKLSRRIANSIN